MIGQKLATFFRAGSQAVRHMTLTPGRAGSNPALGISFKFKK